MKVLIVSPCVNLPVPAVRGGAVSTLIENLVKENEIEKKMDLTVLSIYDPAAVEKSKTYHFTKFEFIRYPKRIDICDRMIDSILSKIKRHKEDHQYLKKQHSLHYISRYVKNNDFDKVVFQNSGFLLNVLRNKDISKKYKGKLFYHLHNDLPDNVFVPGVMQCTLLLISEYLKKNINKVCGRDMSAQCRIVKNGFDCYKFTHDLPLQERRALRESLGIENDKKIVLFTGRIVPEKGILELVNAFQKMEREDLVLLVVGAHNFGTGQTSDFQRKMEQQFQKLGKRVCFTGYVSYDDIWKYYKIADLAVLPSMWEEPAGLTMLEACAAGIPLITTKSGGIPEYIDDRYSVLLKSDAQIEDKILASMNDVLDRKTEWEKKAQLAAKQVTKYYNLNTFYNTFVENI